jgi:hypothetical protein
MAFTSQDDIISEIAGGKFFRSEWNKITGASAYTANRWYDFSALNGYPIANTWSGSALAFQNTNSSSAFSMYTGGNVSTDTKHLINMAALTGVATGVPGTLMLIDMQGYWPGINVNSLSLQTLTGTPTLRYTNGVGCRLFTVATVASGASAHNISLSYTDQGGATGNTLPVTVSMTASAIVGHIAHSGSAANNYGPFLPLASGDYGVQNVASVTFSAASGAGTCALVLARPIAQIPLVTASLLSERDLLNQLPSLPRIYDDACLTWIYFAGAATAANTNFYGANEVAWG